MPFHVLPVESPLGLRARALLGDVELLSDVDLLALVLGSGVRGRPLMLLASQLLEHVGGLEGLSRAGAGQLCDLPGLGKAKALRMVASVELGRRIHVRRHGSHRSLQTPEAVVACFQERIGYLDEEQLWVVGLDSRSRMRGARCVAKGTQHALVVTAREILAVGFAHAASCILLVHNHPSGDPTPSIQDIQMTRACAFAAELVHIPLVDHIILTPDNGHISMLDFGVFEPFTGAPE